jgi:RNA recognition motif-containing protein
VWVNNLPFTVSEEKVRAAFSKFGEITRVDLYAPKGFGFIEYASLDIVKQAIEKCKANPVRVNQLLLAY